MVIQAMIRVRFSVPYEPGLVEACELATKVATEKGQVVDVCVFDCSECDFDGSEGCEPRQKYPCVKFKRFS